MSRTYTLTATTYGGRTTNRNLYMTTMQPWAGGKRAGCWRSGSTDYYGAVSFIFNSGDLATVRGHTIESIKLSVDCSSTFAYSEELIYDEKATQSETSWQIPSYAHEVTVPRYGAIPIIDVTALGVPDYGYVIGGYYRTYAYADVTGGTLTVVTAETSKTITYNANGGTNAPEPTVVWGEGSWEGIVTIHNPTRTGYSFNGWNTQANGGGTSYAPADDITLTADITLYAQWVALKSVINSAPDTEIGSSILVEWDNYGAFVNKLRFAFGQIDSGEISVSGTSHSFSIPNSWLAQLPNATSGIATVYLYTYADGVLIGTSEATFSASVPASVAPSISTVIAEMVNENQTVAGWGIYLQNYSKTRITVSGGAAGTGASIASYAFSGSNLEKSIASNAASANATSDILTASGTLTFTVTITDSRGRTAQGTVSINVTSYSLPSINNMEAYRSNDDGTLNPITGTTILAVAMFSFSAVGQNALTSELSYKRHFDQSYTQAQTNLTSGQPYIIAVGLAEIASSYDVKVEISDSLGNTATFIVIVPPVAGISFGLKNDRARFGAPCEEEGLFVDWDFKIKTGKRIRLGNTWLSEAELQSLKNLIQNN